MISGLAPVSTRGSKNLWAMIRLRRGTKQLCGGVTNTQFCLLFIVSRQRKISVSTPRNRSGQLESFNALAQSCPSLSLVDTISLGYTSE